MRLLKLLAMPRTYAIGALALLWALWAATIDGLVALAWRFRAPADEAGPPDGFLMFPLVRWSGAFQRPQHLAVGLGQRAQAIYVDPMPLHWVAQHPKAAWKTLIEQPRPGVTVLRPWTLPGEAQAPLLRTLNVWHQTQWARMALMALGVRRPALYLHHPWSGDLLGRFHEVASLYDIIDDFTVASWASPQSVQRERGLLAAVDAVATGTHALLERKCGDRPDARFIQCGVEADRFAQTMPPPAAIAEMPAPIIGYFGVINERIDDAILRLMATRHPNWQIAMIGPVHNDFPLAGFRSRWTTIVDDASSEELHLKEQYPNLHFLGLMPYEELPGALARFDVAMLPYKRTPVTEIIHPVKLMEYLAAGKPVVCTRLPDVERTYSEVARLADTPEEFVAHIEAALADTADERSARGLALAHSRPWAVMTDEFLAHYDQAVARRGQ